MPYTIKKGAGGYRVSGPHGTKAKHTTKEKAKRQVRLLRAIDHGWKPTGAHARESLNHAMDALCAEANGLEKQVKSAARQKFERALDELDKEYKTWTDAIHKSERLSEDDFAIRIVERLA
jgi:hypothetical protein